MIIFGNSSKVITTESVKCSCDNCGAQNRIKMSVLQHYTSFFFVPIYPSKKTLTSECSNCKWKLMEFQFPTHFDKEAYRLKAKAKTPLWSRLGLLFIPLFIGFIIVLQQREREKNEAYILAPKAGDVYELKIANEEYTLFKVNHVSTDSVYVSESLYITNTSKGLRKLQKKKYDSETFPIAKPALKEMFDERKIIDVDRKEVVVNE